MSRKSALSAFCASNGILESATRRIAGSTTQRTFSSSAQRNAMLANFTPTSSPQLDELLSTIRRDIILPAYLPTEQRKRLYSPKYAKKLESDPIIIEIDGEVIKFRYINVFKDILQTRRAVVNAITQFSTPQDFANLRPLLEGISYAGRKFDNGVYVKILRVMALKGRVSQIIDCALNAARTGFKLDSSEKVNEILHFIQMKAIDSAWDEAITTKALRRAEVVLELMHEERHQPERNKNNPMLEGELPLYRDPMVLLAPLHLAAALAAQKEGAVDENLADKVNKYARDVVRLWPEGKKLSEVQPKALYGEENGVMRYLLIPNKFVTLTVPLLHSLDTAIKVVEPELAQQLQSRRDILATEIKEARIATKPTENRGEAVYRKLYETEASSENE
ncbi:hypothetical protein F4677DRAFT_443425 [Hypoxylon crocopeplum]|nr:hypothetical protein F4677DRAFT_443425 [Hypoxylon crocopeplum]